MSNNRTLLIPEDSELGVRLRYIARLNPKGVNKLASKHGWQLPANNSNARVAFLNDFLAEEGEGEHFDKAFAEIVDIHPDKQLVIDNHSHSGYEGFEYGNYDGFDIGSIVGSVTDLAKTGLGKIGGKNQLAQGRQAGTQALIAQRQAQIDQEHKTKRTMIYVGIGGGIFLLVAVVGLIIWYKTKK